MVAFAGVYEGARHEAVGCEQNARFMLAVCAAMIFGALAARLLSVAQGRGARISVANE